MAFQPVGLHSCVDLSPHPDYCWLSELEFSVHYFFFAPHYEKSLGYLRLVTRVALLLVIIHKRVRFPLLKLVLMFESSRVQVSGCFSYTCCTALIANIFVGDVRLATSSTTSTWLLTNWTFDFLASRTPCEVCFLELPSNCLSSTLCYFEL